MIDIGAESIDHPLSPSQQERWDHIRNRADTCKQMGIYTEYCDNCHFALVREIPQDLGKY